MMASIDLARHRLRIPFLISLLLSVGLQSGCATRVVRSPLIERHNIQVDLVREVTGFKTEPRGFEHPTIISVPRLKHILGAIEIDTPDKGAGVIRQAAFHPEILEPTAVALAEALGKAGPDQEVGVQVTRKELTYGILTKKYLTTFLAYVNDGHLYILPRRVNWFVPSAKKRADYPKARRDARPMKFRVVVGGPLFYAGPQALEIAWQDPVFRSPYRVAGSSGGTRQRREVLLQSPIPKQELDAQTPGSDSLDIGELSADQLRALADLEEDRQRGLITETAYQRAKRQLLRRR